MVGKVAINQACDKEVNHQLVNDIINLQYYCKLWKLANSVVMGIQVRKYLFKWSKKLINRWYPLNKAWAWKFLIEVYEFLKF